MGSGPFDVVPSCFNLGCVLRRMCLLLHPSKNRYDKTTSKTPTNPLMPCNGIVVGPKVGLLTTFLDAAARIWSHASPGTRPAGVGVPGELWSGTRLDARSRSGKETV